MNKILGGNRPDTQVNINLTISVLTALTSVLLLGFLNGYYDSLYEKTGQTAPTVIYLVYIFLGLVFTWQFLSFLINMRLKRKLSRKSKSEVGVDASAGENALESRTTQKSLPQGDFDNIVPLSVTENTTKILDESRK